MRKYNLSEAGRQVLVERARQMNASLSDTERKRRAERIRAINSNPEIIAKRAANRKPLSEEQRARARDRMLKFNADPDFCEHRRQCTAGGGWKLPQVSQQMKARWQDPEYRAAQLARMHPEGRKKPQKVRKDIEVPKWVPRSLAAEYLDQAKLYGEEHAASVVRAMKRAEQASGEGDHA